MSSQKDGVKLIAQNKKAYHDYFVLEKYEAGLELSGTEVKSVRLGNVNLKDSYCTVKDGEIFARGMHISPYEKGNIYNKDPVRPKRLLMHKREIMKLFGSIKLDGLAVVPLSVYLKGSLVKTEIGLCKGKKLHDKRESESRKDAEREMDRKIKEVNN